MKKIETAQRDREQQKARRGQKVSEKAIVELSVLYPPRARGSGGVAVVALPPTPPAISINDPNFHLK